MAPLYRHPCCRIRRCRRCSCPCGGGLLLHGQAARAKVARSSAQPEGLRSAPRRQSRRSCSASQRTPPRTGATRRQARGAAPCAVLLHAPAARKRSASAPLQARYGRSRSLRGLSAGSASPLRGLAPQGARRTRGTVRLPKSAPHGIIGSSEIKTRPRRVVGVRAPPVSNLPPWLSLLRVAST